jgi:hypothetical protein
MWHKNICGQERELLAHANSKQQKLHWKNIIAFKIPPILFLRPMILFFIYVQEDEICQVFSIVKFCRKFSKMKIGKLLPHGVMGTKITKSIGFSKPI